MGCCNSLQKKQITGQIFQQNNYNLILNIQTWTQQSFNLFDFNSPEIIKQQFIIYDFGYLIQCGNFIRYLERNQDSADVKFESLAILDESQNKVQLMTCNQEDQKTLNKGQIWIALNKQKNKSHELKKGDIIRIGRISFKILKLSLQSQNQQIIYYQDVQSESSDERENKKNCRICLSTKSSKTDPLLSACKCSGTLEMIHFTCLQNCLASKINQIQQGQIWFISKKSLFCELCKTQYPEYLEIDEVQQSTVVLKEPNEPFIILENMINDNSPNQGRYLIALGKKTQFRLGRSNYNDIIIKDISVSRSHIQIKFINNEFQIQDLNSRFGTLILVQQPLFLNQNTINHQFQIDRSILSFELKNNYNCLNFRLKKKQQISPVMFTNDEYVPQQTYGNDEL